VAASVIWAVQNVYEARGAAGPLVRVALARLDGDRAAYRAQGRAARELLCWLARASLGEAASSLEVGATAAGQPLLLAGGQPLADHAVSLSHSHDWVAAGLARGARLGVDVERENPRRRIAAMAEWMGWSDCREAAEFYRAWTYREARIKCRGGSLPAAGEDILPAAPGDVAGRHHVFCTRPAPGVHACMVIETDLLLRTGWSAIGAQRPPTWS